MSLLRDTETPRAAETTAVTAFVFDAHESGQVEDWRAALGRLAEGQLLWLALRDVSEEDVSALQEALELREEHAHRLLESPSKASLSDSSERMAVTLYAAGGKDGQPVLVPIECLLGPNWVVTAERETVEILEEFRERAAGGGQIGELDAPSFVAEIAEWVIAGYFRAFEAVEAELEEFDARVITSRVPNDVTSDLEQLVQLRRAIGTLRRALAPHREVVLALSQPELDALSTQDSARRFAAVERHVIQALDAARETKESTFGSFDLLVARIGQRTRTTS